MRMSRRTPEEVTARAAIAGAARNAADVPAPDGAGVRPRAPSLAPSRCGMGNENAVSDAGVAAARPRGRGGAALSVRINLPSSANRSGRRWPSSRIERGARTAASRGAWNGFDDPDAVSRGV